MATYGHLMLHPQRKKKKIDRYPFECLLLTVTNYGQVPSRACERFFQISTIIVRFVSTTAMDAKSTVAFLDFALSSALVGLFLIFMAWKFYAIFMASPL